MSSRTSYPADRRGHLQDSHHSPARTCLLEPSVGPTGPRGGRSDLGGRKRVTATTPFSVQVLRPADVAKVDDDVRRLAFQGKSGDVQVWQCFIQSSTRTPPVVKAPSSVTPELVRPSVRQPMPQRQPIPDIRSRGARAPVRAPRGPHQARLPRRRGADVQALHVTAPGGRSCPVDESRPAGRVAPGGRAGARRVGGRPSGRSGPRTATGVRSGWPGPTRGHGTGRSSPRASSRRSSGRPRAATAGDRARPLIGVPLAGTGAGGLANVGARSSRPSCRRSSRRRRELGVDVALVVFDEQDHAAVQRGAGGTGARRRPYLTEEQIRRADSSVRLAADGHLALFLGAGVSVAAGLPTGKVCSTTCP